ncbi:MAG: T9SS type A sorting domain-containing protein [Candidatus Latescibacteria bacterium]|nr:T9SS type A sorting domain-containing protein [Candidatus Latescibacterota bacterium]
MGEYIGKNTYSLDWPRNLNPVHIVVVFTKFKGEAPGDSLAPYWADSMFDGTIGSVPHFFDSISFGQYNVTGEYLPKMYEVPHDSSYYVETYTDDRGIVRRVEDRGTIAYSYDVVKLLDEDPNVDFNLFDNEGKDGKPSSGDDDGFVDYLVFMPRSRPYDFIQQLATGVMYLGLKDSYRTQDRNKAGQYIQVDKTSGSISVAWNLNSAIGTIVAELSHAYGAVDLMDKVYVDPTNDSAGIGFWGLLGQGALGWNGQNGPVGPCAYNRLLMNSIGYNNNNLVDLYGIHQGIRMKDVGHPDGKIYRIWINSKEYYLLEYRSNSGGNYYDRNIPESGLLIWHIDETSGNTNSTELMKQCDLECADGRYLDKGYPLGERPDPLKGGDNLDFWAHNYSYTQVHNGNQGDATDVFDGVKYRSFGSETNPNSYMSQTNRPSGIEIFNIHKEGDEMVFDCYIPPIPERSPVEAPRIGMAFQRSSTNSSYEKFLNWERNVYLINFGFGHIPNAVVSVTKDSLMVNTLDFSVSYDTQKYVEKFLLNNSSDQSNTQIVRRYVSVEDFNNMIDDFNGYKDIFGTGQTIAWVQQIKALSGSDALPVLPITVGNAYPNPFNNQTTISYILSDAGITALEVYNVLGQRVLLIDRGFEQPGYHSLRLNSSQLSSGIYLYRLRGSDISHTKKFTVIK